MIQLVTFIAFLSLIAPTSIRVAKPVIEQNVHVSFEYLTDANGVNFGKHYFLRSTVNTPTCVVPYLASQTKCLGSVADPFQLQTNESGIAIGSF